MTLQIPLRNYQSGAALVVGLLLLLVLTLLAISSMNSSTLELMMAGNVQFHQRAFLAAEAGIERGIRASLSSAGPFSPVTGTAAYGDSYTYTPDAPYGNRGQASPSGYSVDTFESIHFEISATGAASRGATSTNKQGFYQVIQATGEPAPDPTACSDSSLLGNRLTCT